MKTFLWFLAVLLWISMSAQDLDGQQPASAVPDDAEARLEQLGISLPQPPKPMAN